MTDSDTLDHIDLADPDLYAYGDPFAVWRRLRRQAPLFWNEREGGTGFWAITKYDDAVRIYMDPESFSSAKGILLSAAGGGGDPAGGKMLALTDPPRHGQVRVLINRWFAPRAVGRLEPTMRRLAGDLVDAALEREECDFVLDLAARLPLSVICELLGVPPADTQSLLELTTQAFGAGGRTAQRTAHQDILLYFMELADARRRAPCDDIVSVLVHVEVDTGPLSEEEVLLNCDNLLVGGTENVRHAASVGLLALLEHPDQARRLRDDPAVARTGADEILRWTSPAMNIMRTTRREVELRGRRIPAGAAVTIWNPSANRDEDVFPEADRFDLTRTPNRHLALGIGEHFCIGTSVARLELRVLFEELFTRTSAIELAGPVTRLRSCEILGLERLPVTLHGR